MPVSHVAIRVSDIASSKAFYDAALAPLGTKIAMSFQDGKMLGYGGDKGPDFWIREVTGDDAKPQNRPVHVAFEAKSKEEVQAFYDAAIAAGGKDNGAPGPRPQYTPNYYGAFVHDPEGNNIEAVYFAPTA
ncbi:glyoxalase/bleomycin resistance protein/dioxygenase [Ephemerocybe angulata]|uniref:Glyoxalase/bleomycin resistance protein/dioxygenase n=1 Tax=Ephemerocybe angulata TaxID=980116 RepID=A0A8H6MAD8_9AGAR|nr:glyoxalase/bleomycin resistance protein/dioxygenase [Tulosesus angulatus]